MQSVNSSMGMVEWLLLIALSVLWGGSFFFVEVAVDALGPLTIVALRVGLAAVALNVMVVAMGLSMPKDRKLWAAFLGMGFFNNMIPFSLIVWGQTHIASGLASILNASTPFFTVVAAHYLTRDERMTGGRLIGVLLGISGVAYMMGAEALEGLATNTLAQLAVLGAAISYAFAGIFGRRFRQLGCSPLVTASGQVTASTVVLIPLALLVERPWILPMPAVEVWWAVLGLALLSTALAYILYFRILATAGATNLLLVTFLIPVSAILLGTAVLGEQLEPQHVVGMALIGLGLAAIDGRPLGIIRGIWPTARSE
ncbi:DMT family transporter [Franzmannia qiaohouensis]|uniref:DMT family transporter n=1 Tax=Franzmannia qiaohouensis TaxID=1329370 RepID=A0ABU1HMI8_9GAMM|nr:DMT family transporter [Halomonas qiaohouensis]MDR5907770.1 DMT family transporter [Halomonas qiaohouensis]